MVGGSLYSGLSCIIDITFGAVRFEMFFGDMFSSNGSKNKDGMSPLFFVVAFEVLAGAAWKA